MWVDRMRGLKDWSEERELLVYKGIAAGVLKGAVLGPESKEERNKESAELEFNKDSGALAMRI